MMKKKKKWKKKKRKKEEKKEEEKEQGEEEERALLTHLVAWHCSLCSCVRSTVLIYLLIWVEWLWNKCVEYWVICSSTHSFAFNIIKINRKCTIYTNL